MPADTQPPPPDNQVVLAWWGTEAYFATFSPDSWWERMEGAFRVGCHTPDHWVALSDARNAAHYRESITRVREGIARDVATGSPVSAKWVDDMLRAALENRP